MKKVLIAPHIMANRHGPHLEVLRNSGLELVFPPRPAQMNEEELLAILPGVTASLAGSEPYTRRVLEANPGLRVIARAGVGYDAVDLTAASAQGIAVTYAPGTNHKAVAEQTFGLMLALGKELMTQNTALRSGRWLRRPSLPLRGRTLGIIGLGRIGKEVALRARAFAMPTLANDIQPDLDFAAQLDIQMVSLERLLAESDFVSLHVPLTSLTRRLMNQRTLAQMKATAFLINTARGPVVCEADLVEALHAGRIAGAGLDVFEKEPLRESPLLQLPNVVLTPHTAGIDSQSIADMAMSAAQSIAAFHRGEWPEEVVVNPEVRAQFRWF